VRISTHSPGSAELCALTHRPFYAGAIESTGNLPQHNDKEPSMGRGDKKTFKGKIFKGSYGKTRPGRVAKKATDATKVKPKT
jgi:30S ribosomal protein S31